ncbi:MAG: DUF4837 family protein [Candidatus Latescibacteria bacterium]|nr:DUF4837 family protein [Candidatus Latescibacterota bacterium]
MKRCPCSFKTAVWALLVVAFLFASGCKELAVPPAGSYSEILLVTEEGKESSLMTLIVPWLTKEKNYVLDKEKPFTVSAIRAADLGEMPAVKNIVICGVADPLTDVGERIIMLIGESGLSKVKAGEANILKRENLPAPGQLTVIVTASSEGELERVIEERGRELEGIIESSCRNRLRRFFMSYPNKTVTDHLYRTYGFAVEVPTLYRLFSESRTPPGVELLRENPSRLLGIFWVDWDKQPTLADKNVLFDIRRKYVWERYNKDAMDSTQVWFSEEQLGEYPAVKMEGYWYNTTATAGGFYQTFFVFQENEELLWAVDLLVYAPGFPKHPHFRELLALAETFRYE